MLHNNIKIIKKSCLLIFVVFISCMFNSCEQTNTVKNSSYVQSQALETTPSNTSKECKSDIGNENDEHTKSSPVNCTPSLNKQVVNVHASRENLPEVSPDWKIYKYPEYGYEVAYPPEYNPSISGGHSTAANPELGMRLYLYSKDNQPSVDIDSIKIDTFHNIDNLIKSKYKGDMTPDGGFSLKNENHKIYSISGEDYYFVFFNNESYIFQLSSSSKELLTRIARTFVFI